MLAILFKIAANFLPSQGDHQPRTPVTPKSDLKFEGVTLYYSSRPASLERPTCVQGFDEECIKTIIYSKTSEQRTHWGRVSCPL